MYMYSIISKTNKSVKTFLCVKKISLCLSVCLSVCLSGSCLAGKTLGFLYSIFITASKTVTQPVDFSTCTWKPVTYSSDFGSHLFLMTIPVTVVHSSRSTAIQWGALSTGEEKHNSSLPMLTRCPLWKPHPVFSYKLRYIVGFWLVEMAISTNQKPTTYHNLYKNTAFRGRAYHHTFVCVKIVST